MFHLLSLIWGRWLWLCLLLLSVSICHPEGLLYPMPLSWDLQNFPLWLYLLIFMPSACTSFVIHTLLLLMEFYTSYIFWPNSQSMFFSLSECFNYLSSWSILLLTRIVRVAPPHFTDWTFQFFSISICYFQYFNFFIKFLFLSSSLLRYCAVLQLSPSCLFEFSFNSLRNLYHLWFYRTLLRVIFNSSASLKKTENMWHFIG